MINYFDDGMDAAREHRDTTRGVAGRVAASEGDR
jgi:hypothetical protein